MKKVLVVDDEVMNVILLQRMLMRAGYSVLTARNGVDALDILSKEDIDLVLLDIMMPEVDGFQVLESIGNNGVICRLPVIMVSALHDEETVNKAYRMGAVGYLKKPIECDDLLTQTQEFLSCQEPQ